MAEFGFICSSVSQGKAVQQNSPPLSCVVQREQPSCFEALAPACGVPGFVASPSATAAAAPARAQAQLCESSHRSAPMCATASPAQHPRVVPAPRCPPALGRAPGLAPNSPAHRLGSVLKEGLRSPVPLQRSGGCAGSGYSLLPWQGVSKTRAAEEAALPLPSQG